MRTLGYNHPLYILPFDHRGSFETKLFGWHGELSAEQTAEIAATKQIIYEGFKAAIAAGVPKDKAGILVDEQFGAAILRDAAAHGFLTACPAEKSGQDEFDFEYGEDFAAHIEAFQPNFCKVLVRYNPEGDAALNERQAARLKRLSDYLRHHSQSRFMFELLVPPRSRRQLGATALSLTGVFGLGSWCWPSNNCRMRASNPMSGRSKGSIVARTAKRSSLPRNVGDTSR
jgi:5-dehydro-2-deoxygluconokinase